MATEIMDANSIYQVNLDGYARKVTVDGTDTYIGHAVPGTAQATAAWRCQKIDTNGTRTWADGDTLFDNVATDLTALSYS